MKIQFNTKHILWFKIEIHEKRHISNPIISLYKGYLGNQEFIQWLDGSSITFHSYTIVQLNMFNR